MALPDKMVFGPAWSGWENYNRFSQSVKNDLRYCRSSDANAFIDLVVQTCESRKVSVPKGKVFWRARLGCDQQEISQEEKDFQVSWTEDRPYNQKDMKPIANWRSEGRANPRGIPSLYLSTTLETALAEVRPWIGAIISAAQFQIARDLSLIDCSKHHALTFADMLGDLNLTATDGIWFAVDQAFATPVSKDDESKEYVPTQIIAEAFKSHGFNGIVYKSLLSEEGFNLALFDLADANVLQCGMHKAKSIHFDFEQTGTEYFVK